jgi:hypothetical protein
LVAICAPSAIAGNFVRYLLDKGRHGEIVDLIMKRWKLDSRIYHDVARVIAKDALVTPSSIQLLIELARESAKMSRPVKVEEVTDFSFAERARKELGLTNKFRSQFGGKQDSGLAESH